MSLFERVNQDIKAAMLAKDKDRLEAIRAVKSAFMLAKTEKAGNELTDEAAITIIQKLVKQRKESADIYKKNNRDELAEKELFQANVIEEYLPEQLSEEELRTVLKDIIAQVGALGMKDMGKVMGTASARLAGKADGKTISGIVRALLS